jgi:hypothetical protein
LDLVIVQEITTKQSTMIQIDQRAPASSLFPNVLKEGSPSMMMSRPLVSACWMPKMMMPVASVQTNELIRM